MTSPSAPWARMRLALRSWRREERRPLPPRSSQEWLWRASAAALLGLTGFTFVSLLEQRHQVRLAERQEALTLLRSELQLSLQVAQDWGQWTEMHTYAASPDPRFLEVNIRRAAVLQSGGVMLAFNNRHQLLFTADRQGLNRAARRPLVQCLQPNLPRRSGPGERILLLCQEERGRIYTGALGGITDSPGLQPANGSLAFLLPAVSPQQSPRSQRLMAQLMADLRPSPGSTLSQAPPAASLLQQELGQPLLNPAGQPLQLRPLSIWEGTAIPLRNTVLVLTLGSGGAVLVRMLWMLERRRQRLEKCRLETNRRVQQRRRQSDEQRVEMERKLNSSLTAAVVAHEIQQPLSTILLHCRLALQDLEFTDAVPAGRSSSSEPDRASLPLQTQLTRRLAALNSEAQRAVQITERMRMLLRNVNTPHKPVNLVTVVESSLLFFRRAISQHAIALSTVGLEGDLWLDGDATQLQSAVNNLLQNAIDALLVQNLRDGRHLHLTLTREASAVRLRIADSGAGFPEHSPALPLTTSKPQGSGLGLFVVRTTMQNHGGRLTLGRSAELGGAEVELLWPLSPERSASGGNGEPAHQDAQGTEHHDG